MTKFRYKIPDAGCEMQDAGCEMTRLRSLRRPSAGNGLSGRGGRGGLGGLSGRGAMFTNHSSAPLGSQAGIPFARIPWCISTQHGSVQCTQLPFYFLHEEERVTFECGASCAPEGAGVDELDPRFEDWADAQFIGRQQAGDTVVALRPA